MTNNNINSVVKITSFFITLCLFCSIFVGCGNSAPEISGKYYHEDTKDLYYEFVNSTTCYLRFDMNGKPSQVTYKYVINEDTDFEGVYTVHISDVASIAVHKIIYDKAQNTIWDPELGLFKKK